MAVIQISKIQQRRGRKLSDIGVPQLSSGEFAWAVDTQELFIGNGSITEGAPYVGNTKILTEHDNILELASSYRFAEPDINITGSVERSLQTKLDEYVSVLDFGATPDGSTDCTEAFETAFDELFKNSDSKYKKTLRIPNGIYLFTTDLRIPSTAILMGDNPRETILRIENNNIIFVSENGTDGISTEFNDSDKPHDIIMSNLTIEHNTGQTIITAANHCEFTNVIWQSDYVLGETVFVPTNASAIYNSPITSEGGKFFATVFGIQLPDIDFSETHANTLEELVNTLEGYTPFFTNFVAQVSASSIVVRTRDASASSNFITSNFQLEVQTDNLSETFIVTPETQEFRDGSESVSASVFWNNKNFGTATTKNKFHACKFEYTPLSIECRHETNIDDEEEIPLSSVVPSTFSTSIEFESCDFYFNDISIYINAPTGQRNQWIVHNCTFENIANQAINSTGGVGTKIKNCNFKNCGNGNTLTPVTSIIKFGEKFNNIVIDCSSDRHQTSEITSSPLTPSVIGFENVSIASLVDRNYESIYYSEGFRPLAVFPVYNKFITIDYFLSLGNSSLTNYSRIGKIIITIGDDLSGTIYAEEDPGSPILGSPGESSEIAISDNYVYSPSTPTAPGGSYMTNFEFSIEVRDNDEDSGLETAVLKYRNPSGGGVIGNISYSITYGV